METIQRTILLVITLVVLGAVIISLERQRAKKTDTAPAQEVVMTQAEKEKKYKPAKELVNPSGFINTEHVAIKDLVGKKVVLLDFWTYSCINCQRTLPYLNSWYETYRNQGLEIVGVHTPEFAFEQERKNVQAAVKKYGIMYPVVLDNDYATWRAYGNRYWPRKYLIDIDGYVVYDHIGEGAYEETERKIQELLRERNARLGAESDISSDIARPETSVGAEGAHSPEIYFGALRNEQLGNGRKRVSGRQEFTLPSTVKPDTLYLGGSWNIADEFAENADSGATVTYRYTGKDVYLVASSSGRARLTIRRDGQPLGAAAGADVDANGRVAVEEDRLYTLVHDAADGEHTLEITVEDPGVRAYTLTFG